MAENTGSITQCPLVAGGPLRKLTSY